MSSFRGTNAPQPAARITVWVKWTPAGVVNSMTRSPRIRNPVTRSLRTTSGRYCIA